MSHDHLESNLAGAKHEQRLSYRQIVSKRGVFFCCFKVNFVSISFFFFFLFFTVNEKVSYNSSNFREWSSLVPFTLNLVSSSVLE